MLGILGWIFIWDKVLFPLSKWCYNSLHQVNTYVLTTQQNKNILKKRIKFLKKLLCLAWKGIG